MNVILLREMAPRAHGSEWPPAEAGADTSELVLRVADLQSKAKGKVCTAVLMLDLAAQHAHEISKKISDPAARQDFEAQVVNIERLLQIARDMAIKL